MDIERHRELAHYLRQHGHVELDEPCRYTTLSGGVSNRCVLVERQGDSHHPSLVIKQALSKLRVDADWRADPARIHREAEGMRALGVLLEPGQVPALRFEDRQLHLLAMTAVPTPHQNWKSMLLHNDVQPDHVRQFATILARIHTADPNILGHFTDRSFFESLRLQPYYAHTATRLPGAATFLEALIRDTQNCNTALVHGDFSPKNILVRQGKLILLDHEVIHRGDPAFDTGFALTHLLAKANHVCPATFEQAATVFWQTYLEQGGPASEAGSVRHTIACLLARVDGKSPLEYLTATERDRQRHAALDLIRAAPDTVIELIRTFTGAMT
ncbi:MAG: phosphotransferase [Proteobacteria bacterium]|nr:phosphotransferase [Pseudomonadota bacterium]MDA1300925.1 phosphotransferase [Pseudomonadota bacterium]